MTDYRQDQTSMIYDLIDKSNPGFKALCPPGSMQFGTPVIVPVDPKDPYKNDTQILMSVKPGSGATIGHLTVKYRRINLTNLLRGKTCLLSRWLITTTYPIASWVPDFATMFGISLTVKDFSPKTAQLFAKVVYNLTIEPTSLCYTGAVIVSWTPGVPNLSTLVTNAIRGLPGLTYPDGGNGLVVPKPIGELMTYAQDVSALSVTLNSLPVLWNPASGNTLASFTSILKWLNANTGTTNWSNADLKVPGGLGNSTWNKYTLPNAALPEANSAKYKTAIVVHSAVDSWFAGKLILHYNG